MFHRLELNREHEVDRNTSDRISSDFQKDVAGRVRHAALECKRHNAFPAIVDEYALL
jgi:hypothetical protein